MPEDQIVVITAVKYLRVDSDLGRGIQIEDEPTPIFLTNDPTVLRKLLSQQFILEMGRLEAADIVNVGCGLYSRFDGELPGHDAAVAFLNHWLYLAKSFFHALWFVKDNSVDSEVAFMEWRHLQEGASYSSNFIAARLFDSQGEHNTSPFSVDEIKRARTIYKEHMRPLAFYGNDVAGQKLRLGAPGNIVATKGVSNSPRAFLSKRRPRRKRFGSQTVSIYELS